MRRFAEPMVVLAGLVVGFCGFLAFAQSDHGRTEEPAALIGVTVYSADGQEVGTVSAVTVEAGGSITEIRVTTSSPLGLGERTVAIEQGSFNMLDGAVVLEFSATQVDALPSSQPAKRLSTLA